MFVLLFLLLLGNSPVYHDAARVIQSSRCTVQERQDHIQCFDVLPLDQYAVPLGSTVNMQCVVLNQHGKVQWRAKKILLGYDRSIPGYPRYRIIGDVGRGEHTLQIMDVQLDDAGEYECQVTPVPANNHPLLRRRTKLIVLVKPSIPRILYPDIPPPDNQLVISQPDPIARITVLCVSSGGSPPPVFTWSLNNREIPFTLTQSPQAHRRPEHAFWNKLTPLIHSPSNQDESRLSLLKSGLKDGDHLSCSVTNAATQTHHDPQQHNLTTRVVIRIHTPPGPPRILSPKSNQEYLEGEELKAVCAASPPGNPFGGLFWRWLLQPSQVDDSNVGLAVGLGGHGGARLSDYSSVQHFLQHIGQTHLPGSGDRYQSSELISEDVQPLHYSLNKEKDQLINTLTIPRISRRYHAAKLVCETGHPVGNAQHTSINIYVKYPPANVTIEVEGDKVREELATRRREYVVYGRAGETKTLICRTSSYFRQANIKWIWQSADTNLDRSPKQLIGQSKSIRTADGESWYQESKVEVRFTEEDDRSYVDCRVWGEGDSRIDARVRLDIIYPPDSPIITGYKSLQPVKMAHALELKCITTGGNPPPTLTWYRDKSPLTSQEDVVILGSQSTLRIRIVPQKDDNGAHYHCSATNAATDRTGVPSEPVILNVIFPPQRVTISFHGHSQVPSGQPLVIDCQADTSNPAATITWWHYRCGPAHAFDNIAERSDEAVRSHDGPLAMHRTSDNTKCKSVQVEGTEEKPISGAAGGLHAHSRLWLRPTWKYHMDYIECRTENLEYGPPVWHDRLQLNITFAPQFLGLQNRNEYVIREGQTMNLDLGPYANPQVSLVNWFTNGQQLRSLQVQSDSTPEVYATGQMGELLALNKVTREHMGNYTVVASNDIGQSTGVFFLNVTYPPTLIGNTEENITEVAEGRAMLHCEASANPAVPQHAFAWYRYVPPPGWPQDVNEAAVELSPPIRCNRSDVFPSRDDKLFTQCQQDTMVQMRSILTIFGINRDDVGTYICEVNNGLGEPIRKRIHFVHPFEPTIIHLPRYTRAAGEQGSVVTLTCLIRTEPIPKVVWLKDKQMLKPHENVDPSAPVSTTKYRLQFEHIRPGLYKSTLTLTNLQKSDFATYHCQAVNIKGEALLEVQLSGTSTPDVPLNLRLLNSTTNSLRVAWTQGFDGGLTQTFQVRWRQAGSQTMFKYADVAANDNHHAVEYLITGLESGTEYLISVNSMNAKHGASDHTDFIHVRTDSYDRYSGSHLVPPLSSAGPSDDNAILIIVAACVFGFVILLINLIVITFLIKRRKQRQSLIRQNKLRKSNAFATTMSNGFAMTPTNTRFESYGPQDAKLIHDNQAEQLNHSLNSTQADSCICCPHSRLKPAPASYIRTDSFETFGRANGQAMKTYVNMPVQADESREFRRLSVQQHHMGYGIPANDMSTDLDHGHINHFTSGFPLSQSYHSASTADGATVMRNTNVGDLSNYRHPAPPDAPMTPISLSGMAKDSSLPFDQAKSGMQQLGKQYTPKQATVRSRYAGKYHRRLGSSTEETMHLSRDCLNCEDHHSMFIQHKSMMDLLPCGTSDMDSRTHYRPSATTTITNTSTANFRNLPSMEFLPGQSSTFSEFSHPVNMSVSRPRLSETFCHFAKQRPYTPKPHNLMRFSDTGYLSDIDNGYDQDLYAKELRRVQYGRGPAAELLLNNCNSSGFISYCNETFLPDQCLLDETQRKFENRSKCRFAPAQSLFLNPNNPNVQLRRSCTSTFTKCPKTTTENDR